jgi:hypothetical protein
MNKLKLIFLLVLSFVLMNGKILAQSQNINANNINVDGKLTIQSLNIGSTTLNSFLVYDTVTKQILRVYPSFLNSYLLKTDTSAMLSPYLRSAVAAASYYPLASNPLNYYKPIDTISTLATQYYASTHGGVTSFNTRTGAVTLTLTDVLNALGYAPLAPTDTAAMLAPYLRSAIAASTYATIANLALKVNISDTAAMLSAYLRSALGMKYTDSAVMLAPYLRSAVAAGTYATIANLALKVNISDTSAMLAPYKKTGLDTLYRTVGKDSLQFTINGRYHSILDSAGGGVGTAVNTVKKIIAQTAHGFTVNEPVYLDTTATTWHAADTINFAMAIVDSVVDANNFEATFEGTYNATAHGLSTGKYYYVTMPAGSITTASPKKSQPLFVPIDANTIKVHLYRPVDFNGTTGGSSSDSAVINGYGLLKNVTGTSITLTVDTTTLKTVFTGSGGGSQTFQQVLDQQATHKATLTAYDTVVSNGLGMVFDSTSKFDIANRYTGVRAGLRLKPNVGNFEVTSINYTGGTFQVDSFANYKLGQGFQTTDGGSVTEANTTINSVTGSPFKLLFSQNSSNTRFAGLSGNGTSNADYFAFGINDGQTLGNDGVHNGIGLLFDSRLTTVMRFAVDNASTNIFCGAIASNGVWTFGTTTDNSTGEVQILKTTAQLALHYDASNRAQFTVGSGGILTIAPTGITTKFAAGTTAAASLNVPSGTLATTIGGGNEEYNNAFYASNSALNRVGIGGPIVDFTTDAGNTGTAETDLYTYTTKTSTLASTGEKLKARFSGNVVGSATASRSIIVYFAGTVIFTTGSITVSSASNFDISVNIIRTGATTARAIVNATIDGVSLTSPITETDLTGLTFTNTNILKITGTSSGTGSASNDIIAKLGDIFWYPAANN